jgi:hypothetical protein
MVYVSIYSPTARAYFESINYSSKKSVWPLYCKKCWQKIIMVIFYPHISGTAQSFNYYPVAGPGARGRHRQRRDGLANMWWRGGKCYRFCPRRPQTGSSAPEAQVQASQRYFYALNLRGNSPICWLEETVCYARIDIAQGEAHGTLAPLASVWDIENHPPAAWAVRPRTADSDFANILNTRAFHGQNHCVRDGFGSAGMEIRSKSSLP